jgi:nucleoside-diphosphate-sugar epimerase
MRWLTNEIGTAAYNDLLMLELDVDVIVLDVRDLVDKSGNDIQYVILKINDGVDLLRNGNRIIVCCDYGMSRSNSIAAGIIIKFYNLDFSSAVQILKDNVDESGIKVEMLNTIYQALYAPNHKKVNEKNILVTGGNGFLGKSVIKKLSFNYSITAPSSTEINLLNDSISLDLKVKERNIDTIIHLANPKIFTTNKSVGDTLVMLKNILDVCRTNGVRLIFLSGWEIYSGYNSAGLMANESLPANAKGTYGETKWLCELLIKQYVANYNIKCQILRSGPVYGALGEKPKFIYNFIDKALCHKDIVTHKYINGFPGLDLLYIDDLVNLIEKSVQNDLVGDFNIGSGTAISTHEIAEIISQKLSSKSTIRYTDIREYAPNIIMDTHKIKTSFRWEPTVKLMDGLDLVIKNYQSINQ